MQKGGRQVKELTGSMYQLFDEIVDTVLGGHGYGVG